MKTVTQFLAATAAFALSASIFAVPYPVQNRGKVDQTTTSYDTNKAADDQQAVDDQDVDQSAKVFGGFQYDYAQPSFNGLNNIPIADSTGITANPVPILPVPPDAQFPNQNDTGVVNLGLGFSSAFKGIYGYQFPNSNNQIFATYQYLHSDTVNSREKPFGEDGEITFGAFFHVLPVIQAFFNDPTPITGFPNFNTTQTRYFVEGRAETTFHNAQLLARTQLSCGGWISFQPYGGIHFAYDKLEVTALGELNPDIPAQVVPVAAPAIDELDTETATFRNDFWSLGPELGSNVIIHIYRQVVSLVLGANASVMFGQTDSHYDSVFTRAFFIFPEDNRQRDYDNVHRSVFRFIPAMAGNLALRINFHVRHVGVELEGGYRGEIYFNAVDNNALVDSQEAITRSFGGLGLDNAHTTRQRTGSFKYGGPFIKLVLYLPTCLV